MFSVSSASEVWKLLLDRSQTTRFTSQVLRQVYLLRGFLAMAAEQWDVSGPWHMNGLCKTHYYPLVYSPQCQRFHTAAPSWVLMWLQIKLQLRDNDQGERLLTSAHCIPPAIRSWYFHWSTDQRCPETTRVTSNSIFCIFVSQFVSSDFVSRAECRDWSWHMFHSELPSKTQGT